MTGILGTMKWLVIAAIAMGCGASKDDCTRVKDNVRPVIAKMMADANKSIASDKLEALVAELCADSKEPGERQMFDCLKTSSTDAATAACLEPEFKAYRDGLEQIQKRSDERRIARAVRDADVPAPTAPPIAPPIDAAPPPPVPPTLPEWPVTDPSKGTETELTASDAPADVLIADAFETRQVLMLATGKRVTGHVLAPSAKGAALAVMAATGITMPPVLAKHGHGVAVTLKFAGAPQHDLLRLLGDVLHANTVVGPAALPDVTISVDHFPADGVLDALAALDHLTVKREGSTVYLLAPGEVLPPLPRLPGNKPLELRAFRTSLRVATNAIAALAPGFPVSCSDAAVDALLRGRPNEIARALQIASGAKLEPGTCSPIAEGTDATELVAIASSGTVRIAIGLAHGAPVLLRPSKDVEITEFALTIKGREIAWSFSHGEQTAYAPWRALWQRTAAMRRSGPERRAWLESSDRKLLALDLPNAAKPLMSLYNLPDGVNAEDLSLSPAGVVISRGSASDVIPLK